MLRRTARRIAAIPPTDHPTRHRLRPGPAEWTAMLRPTRTRLHHSKRLRRAAGATTARRSRTTGTIRPPNLRCRGSAILIHRREEITRRPTAGPLRLATTSGPPLAAARQPVITGLGTRATNRQRATIGRAIPDTVPRPHRRTAARTIQHRPADPPPPTNLRLSGPEVLPITCPSRPIQVPRPRRRHATYLVRETRPAFNRRDTRPAGRITDGRNIACLAGRNVALASQAGGPGTGFPVWERLQGFPACEPLQGLQPGNDPLPSAYNGVAIRRIKIVAYAPRGNSNRSTSFLRRG